MASSIVQMEGGYYPFFDKGQPIAGGQLYVGLSGFDPEPIGNQIAVQAVQQDGSTVPMAQPITLSAGGVPSLNGANVVLVTDGDYSMKVLDKIGGLAYYHPRRALGAPLDISDSVRVFATVAIAKEQTYKLGQLVQTIENTAGNGGGAEYVVEPLGTPDGFGDHATDDGNFQITLIIDGVLNIKEFGLIDGADNTAAITAGISRAATDPTIRKVEFPAGDSIISAVIRQLLFTDNFTVDFSGHVFTVTANVSFIFGDAANNAELAVPNNNHLTVIGGEFNQASDTTDRTYLHIYDTRWLVLRDTVINNVGNGAITIGNTMWDFEIDNISGTGINGNSTRRAIWLNGAGVVGYLSQVIDTSTFVRNATNPRTLQRGSIHDCKLLDQSYGIYLINAIDIEVHHNDIRMNAVGANRCIAFNNDSINGDVHHNYMESSVSATGIIATQGATVDISHNNFKGDFGGNRDIYVQYAAEANISHNKFKTDTTQQIEVDNGGFATVEHNVFKRESGFSNVQRSVLYRSIDPNNLSLGGTATSVGGLIFRNNHCYGRGIGVQVEQNQSTTGGNYLGCIAIDIMDNVFHDRNDASITSSQRPLNIIVNDDSKPMNFSYGDNLLLPYNSSSGDSVPFVTGTATASQRKQSTNLAGFNIDIVGGVVTTTKLFGTTMTLSAVLSANSLLLSPRTGGGQSGVAVADIIAVIPKSSNAGSMRFVNAGLVSPILDIYDTANVKVALATTDASVFVLIGSSRLD